MNSEFANVVIAVVGLLLSIILNWEKLRRAPKWLVAFFIGLCSGFAIGYLV